MAQGVGSVDYDLETGKQPTVENVKMTQSWMARRNNATISKVRKQLRAFDDNIYKPQCMPIGPHHLTCSSPWMEEEKLRCVSFLQSLCEEHTGGGLTGIVEKLEPQVRECYPDGVGHLSPEELSSMMLRDGCYLLLFFVDYASGVSSKMAPQGDCPTTGGNDNTVLRDIVFLLENQIPLFVLQKIHQRVTGDSSSVLDDIAIPVQVLLQEQLYISEKLRPAPSTSSDLLHLAHFYFKPTKHPSKTEVELGRRPLPITGRWRRATEYSRFAGVRFKRRDFKNVEEWTVLDVRLKRGTLWIPRLRVDSSTWTLLRNLMALEEQKTKRPVTAYCVFMSQVACTVEDVELLQRAGIVEHFLASDEHAARGFADLCKGVVIDIDNLERNYLKPVWHGLDKRSSSRAHRFISRFCHCQQVGIAVAFLLAIIIFACQVTQTFYTITGGGQH